MKKTITTLFTLLVIMTGCSTYPNYKQNNSSIISGGRANFVTFTLGTSGHLGILKIDGIKTGGLGFDKYTVKSGNHLLNIYATNGSQSRSGKIIVNLLPHKKYKLKAFFDTPTSWIEPARIELLDATSNSKIKTYYLNKQ